MLALADERHGLEARVDAEGPKDGPDVVADRLHTDVQVSRDLIGGAALFEQAQDFDLAGRQVRMRGRRSILVHAFDLAEDADDVVAVPEWHTADLQDYLARLTRRSRERLPDAPVGLGVKWAGSLGSLKS